MIQLKYILFTLRRLSQIPISTKKTLDYLKIRLMIDTETKNMGEKYSIPHEAQKLFTEGILKNPLISKSLPLEALDYGAKVKYVGSDAPSIPINWRFAESISSLKGLEATLLNVLLSRKYGVEPQEVVINTYVETLPVFIWFYYIFNFSLH